MNRIKYFSLLSLLLISIAILAVGCSGQSGNILPSQGISQPDSFTGTVRYLDFEGGFYGVQTHSHGKLRGALPEALQKDGLKISGQFTDDPQGDISFQQWGRRVIFSDLKKVD